MSLRGLALRAVACTALLLGVPIIARAADPQSDRAPIRLIPEAQRQALARIDAALSREVSFDFHNTPLVQVVEFFADQGQIEIEIDQTSLDDSQVPRDAPFTKEANGISLRAALKLVLGEYEVQTTLLGEVLSVYAGPNPCPMTEVRVYSATDLLERDKEGHFVHDELVRTITKTVGATTWDAVGGEGVIVGFRGALVITQYPDVHEQIEHLLSALRKLQAEN